MSSNAVWFITGCSTGFGRALAKKALLTGAKVVVTSRNISDIKDFEKDFPENALLFALDVTDSKQIKAAVEKTKKAFGHIDVLINNAGYGLMGAVEEVPEQEIKKLFDTNVFGLLAVTREILPIMREQKSGYIINISSVSFPAYPLKPFRQRTNERTYMHDTVNKEAEEFIAKIYCDLWRFVRCRTAVPTWE